MRTTLKRGIGRGAAVNGNGNGRAILPPVAPPFTIYRQPEPSRRGVAALILKGLLWLLAGIVSVFVSLAGGYYLWLHEVPTSLRAVSKDVIKAQKDLGVPIAGKPTIALVVGYDKRKGVERELASRSDTIMLMRADPTTDSISMMSFPRDLQVLNYCPGRAPVLDRINTAYTMCGAQGTLTTVKELTGLDVNYLITVNFAGFKQVVDKLGGVWIDVDRRYFNDNARGFERYATIDLQPGYQKLNGRDALDYVRFRHTDSDLYRLARQQGFVKAMKEQISHSFLPISIPRIVGAITRNHNVQVGAGGGKEVDFDTIKSYGFMAYKTPAGHIFTSSIEGLTGDSVLSASESSMDAAVQDFLNPDVEAPEKAGAVALGRKPRLKTGPRASTVPVLVLNGNGVAGAATTAGAQLLEKGYPLVLPANGARADAPSYDYGRTKVYFDPRQASGQPAAKRIAALFGEADVDPIPAALKPLQNGAMEIVVVGATYRGTLAAAPRDKTPKRQPPDVRSDSAASKALLQPLRTKVGFPLQVPTVIEGHSQPDLEVPIRSYWIGKRRAVRQTFKTSLDVAGFWGITQTNWADPPLLDKPNRTIFRKGRRYDLFFEGAHLHVVALREEDASYWVTNTLLNKLSNETMLAIARGLRPLGSAK
ncbi:MAG: LCP family protein [Actinomycetota bacterium]|nr:LCP family protein [Actinomycetota bacterium]